MKRSAPKPSSEEGRRDNGVRGTPRRQTGSSAQQSIRDWLKQVRFRKAVIGGVREPDVWKKIAELNTMYEAALSAERVRYDTLLKERVPVLARQMAQQMYRRAVEQEKNSNGQYN